ncbi:MAG: signal peptidase II [Candidatus Altimarinota bacterium]
MFYIGIFFLIFIDLFTKFIAKNDLIIQKNLVGDFLYFRYVENIGIAFSLPITGIVLKVLTIILIGVIFWYYYTEEKKKNLKIIDASFMFVLAGALGNGYERVFNGKVIDFIGVKYFSVFNIADIFITIGVVLYIYSLIFLQKK